MNFSVFGHDLSLPIKDSARVVQSLAVPLRNTATNEVDLIW